MLFITVNLFDLTLVCRPLVYIILHIDLKTDLTMTTNFNLKRLHFDLLFVKKLDVEMVQFNKLVASFKGLIMF